MNDMVTLAITEDVRYPSLFISEANAYKAREYPRELVDRLRRAQAELDAAEEAIYEYVGGGRQKLR